MFFSEDGANDDELAEVLDFQIDGEDAVLWCRRQDARRFKREQCGKTGARIFSVPVEGEEKPRYLELSIIRKNRPAGVALIRRRVLRTLSTQIKMLVEIESIGSGNRVLFGMEDEISEIVREMLAAAVREKGLKSA
jgi:hypothetical protein